MRLRRPSPVTLLALLLVGAGVVAMRRDGAPPPRADEACDPESGVGCPPLPGEAPGGGALLPAPTPSRVPTLPARTACRDAGYLCGALDSYDRIEVHRWRGFDGTVVVHVPRPDLPDAGLAQRLQRAATAGIRLWNGLPFPILVDERGNRGAHFSVRWSPSLGGAKIGEASVSWGPQQGLRVLVLDLATQNPYTGRPMEPEQVRLVAAHEMGHALGLPHSDEPRDVMYPTNTATTLSARDYRTLERLYELEDGTVILRSPPR